jgi:hypothetical protein
VKRIKQTKLNSCWAASSAMVRARARPAAAAHSRAQLLNWKETTSKYNESSAAAAVSFVSRARARAATARGALTHAHAAAQSSEYTSDTGLRPAQISTWLSRMGMTCERRRRPSQRGAARG